MKIGSGLFSIFCLIIIIPSILLIYSMNYDTTGNIGIWLTILVTIIDIVAVVMWVWIYKRILVPLDKLQIATKRIADGDLDYQLDERDFSEIPFLYNDFERMRIKLKEDEEEKKLSEDAAKELVSNISHDLKTPLTAIRGYVEGILDGVASSPQKTRDYLNTIYNKTNDMTSLIDELLYYSQVAEKHMSYKYEKIYVKEFFDEYVKDLYLELETIKIKFEYIVDIGRNTVIDMDKEQIKRALNNIVSNAVKYMDKEEPEIHFRVTETSDAINIQISDNGRGIDEKDLPHIFERFYRSDVSRNTKLGGSGIGLSIVKKVIENHEGSVVAVSKPGVGTEVGIELKK
ncbi:sensor histidine kinase [Lachnoanaerobaculum gingivalis]|uniref:histidine kinase n=1 Tax=Lachnoanaerobaculum gingivalis TaxID=2490855 RepID=A0A3P3QVC9_9FIRM|nr:HAMP domain-containing sensor histidine kinase [Lachnoanaerobaculum gingivalis]RRJ25164.1 sensor histidine kinase [Lachnoanaerobaculum gingivalis]WHE88183.1 HAMP domain-containing sensor histidine kinase [Lachnoanaerobaculum gingivalis]